jgi:hypothetical protein
MQVFINITDDTPNNIYDDINNIDLSIYKNKQAFVFFSNLCMPPLFTNTIFKKLQKELSPGSIICCSINPNEKIGNLLPEGTVDKQNLNNYLIKEIKK